MTLDPKDSPRLRRLLDALCEGTISEEQMQELESQALANPLARQQLLAYLEVDACLRWEFGAGMEPATAPATDNRATVVRRVAPRETWSEWFDALTQRLTFPQFVRAHAVVFSVAAVAMLFYSAFAAISWNLWGLGTHSQAMLNSFAASDAKNAGRGENNVPGSALDRPQDAKFESLVVGSKEFELEQGAKVVIEAPSEWAIDGKNHISLRSGKLFAQVSPRAKGFTVATPSAVIVDFGTEFGVAADASGETHVEVFQGEVAVAPRAKKSEPMQPEKLIAGESRRVGPQGTISTEAVRREGFIGLNGKRNVLKEPATPSKVVVDRFTGKKIDESLWTTNTDLGLKDCEAKIEGNMLQLKNRAYLISREQFHPTADRPLRITGKFYFANPGDSFKIVTRSSGTPHQNEFREVADGIHCCLGIPPKEEFGIASSGDLEVEQIENQGKLEIVAGMALEFEVIDQGDMISFQASQTGNPANRAKAKARVKRDEAKKHFVVLYNREKHSDDQILYLNELRLEQVPTESKPLQQ